MKKMSEKTFIIITGVVGGVLGIITSLLVKYEVISQLFEFPIFVTLFTLCVLVSSIVDKYYFKSKWSKKQTIGMIVFNSITVIATILAWIFK